MLGEELFGFFKPQDIALLSQSEARDLFKAAVEVVGLVTGLGGQFGNAHLVVLGIENQGLEFFDKAGHSPAASGEQAKGAKLDIEDGQGGGGSKQAGFGKSGVFDVTDFRQMMANARGFRIVELAEFGSFTRPRESRKIEVYDKGQGAAADCFSEAVRFTFGEDGQGPREDLYALLPYPQQTATGEVAEGLREGVTVIAQCIGLG